MPEVVMREVEMVVLLGLLAGCGGARTGDTSCASADCAEQVGDEPGEQPGEQPGDPPGDVSGLCDETTASLSDAVVDGHSGAEALALLGGPHVYDATRWDGSTTTLTISAVAASDTVTAYVPASGYGTTCVSRIELDAIVDLSTSDGGLAESVTRRIVWEWPWDEVDVRVEVPLAELGGALDADAIAPGSTKLYGAVVVGGDRGDFGYLGLDDPALSADPIAYGWGDLEGVFGGTDTGDTGP